MLLGPTSVKPACQMFYVQLLHTWSPKASSKEVITLFTLSGTASIKDNIDEIEPWFHEIILLDFDLLVFNYIEIFPKTSDFMMTAFL